mgnify:CR=1 FL=1
MGVAIGDNPMIGFSPGLDATIRAGGRGRQDAGRPESSNKAALMAEISIDKMFIAIAAMNA